MPKATQKMSSDLRIGRVEFVALMAMMTAMTAFSIDSMLPALPEIAAELSPDAPNAAQLILSSFLVGMGIGTFFTGPLSDAFGRKPIIYAGGAIYIVAAVLAWVAQTLELVLAARFLQGVGMAGPRIVTLAIIRDLFAGRQMAKLVSIVMMIFTLVPAVAPLLGAFVIDLAGWRGIFVSFVLFCVTVLTWMTFRLDETLPRANRRPFKAGVILAAIREMMGSPMVRIVLVVQTLCLGMLFGALNSVQPIYEVTFGRAESFPYWFALVATCAGGASFVNAKLVVRVGMRLMVTATLLSQLFLSLAMIVLTLLDLPDPLYFHLFVFWQFTLFAMAGLTLGNLNALAMEPLGHIAGTAASVIGGVSTVGAMLFAVPIGLAFDGTPRPVAIGVFVLVVVCTALMHPLHRLERQAR